MKRLFDHKISRRSALKVGAGLAAATVGARFLVNPTLIGLAQTPPPPKKGKITPADRKAAAANAAKKRAEAKASGIQIQAIAPGPGQQPDYWGMTPNYANSQLPASISIIGDGIGALATPVLAGDAIGSVTIDNPGSGYTLAATTVTAIGGGGSGAILTPTIDPVTGEITAITVTAGGLGYNLFPGIRKFVDTLPLLNKANNLGQMLPVAVPDAVTYAGADYYEIGLVEYTQQMHSDLLPTKLRGYVQLNDPATVAQVTRDGSGKPTAWPKPQYLGPVIVAQRDRPVRIKFYNLLPTGTGGNLFIPVDKSLMGAGATPVGFVQTINVTNGGSNYNSVPTVTLSGGGGVGATATAVVTNKVVTAVKVTLGGMNYTSAPTVTFKGGSGGSGAAATAVLAAPGEYTENRAAIHLHGGVTPWISDGTPHQWITPAGETTAYPKGVSVVPVPDMPAPKDGEQTIFYTNQQSARLMFYHDHAVGLTRLNVYAGEAAGFVLRDLVEQGLVANGTIPSDEIPLIIQDKTFVPDATQLAAQDPTWDTTKWSTQGGFWFPHTYMTNQNPWDPSGANPCGRWDYGPWFWPPFNVLTNGPLANQYYDPINAPWQPPQIPGTPTPSTTPEAFMDTPVVNGTAYPVLSVDPHAYRFRVLNACNDRFLNLQLYTAGSNGAMWNGTTLLDPDAGEVPMVPAVATPGFPSTWPTDGRDGGVPDPAHLGPKMIQIGTEGGFLPAPVVLDNTPVGYNYNRRDIVVLNITNKTLLMGPAERADIIIDFSPYAGKTLILYNDAPAPVPAFDPRIDYYTGNPDQTSTGGAPSTQPGYGPNTRTIMQIKVNSVSTAGDAVTDFTVTNSGADYTGQPTITIDAPTGAGGALATAGQALFAIDHLTSPTNGGSGYTTAPAVTIDPPAAAGGVQALATATIANGSVTGFKVTNPGSGYLTAPAVTIAPPQAGVQATVGPALLKMVGLTLGFGGSGYLTSPHVTITGGGGVGAAVTANLASGTPFNLANLNTAFASTATTPGVFAASQDPIIVPQNVYNSAYAGSFPVSNVVSIADTQMTFTPRGAAVSVTKALLPKAIQELFEVEYGRMNAILGVEIPNTNGTNQTTIPYYYADPATEIISPTFDPMTPIGATNDGIQFWKITHNGVDTHAIHFHLFNVQIINRVGWDGAKRAPDANELGWKETVKMNPLEDCIVALRAVMPTLPFSLPNSVRPMVPSLPLGSQMGFTGIDPTGQPAVVTNQVMNFGHEYVWHCHLLGHEENDMMRPIIVTTPPDAPTALNATGFTNKLRITLNWTFNPQTTTAANFIIQRATEPSFVTNLQTFKTNGLVNTYTDQSIVSGTTYYYRVMAAYVAGDTAAYPAPTAGYPWVTVSSAPSNVVSFGFSVPLDPTNLVATQALPAGSPVILTWTDNANNEQNYTVQRATSLTGTWTTLSTLVAAVPGVGGKGTYSDTRARPGTSYYYRVMATNAIGNSAFVTMTTPILIH